MSATITAEQAVRYSDQWLEWAAHSPFAGLRHTAPILARVPECERLRAVGLANSIMNRMPLRYSDAVALAVGELHDANYAETTTEREGRMWREQERQRKADELALAAMRLEAAR